MCRIGGLGLTSPLPLLLLHCRPHASISGSFNTSSSPPNALSLTFIFHMSKRRKLSHSPSPSVIEDVPRPVAPWNKASLPNRPMNDIPLPASHPRPGRQLFICGAGDNGQLGMGTSAHATQEHRKPRLHVGFELAMNTGLLGEEQGAGIEGAVAGGMHSLVIDESGRVRSRLL